MSLPEPGDVADFVDGLVAEFGPIPVASVAGGFVFLGLLLVVLGCGVCCKCCCCRKAAPPLDAYASQRTERANSVCFLCSVWSVESFHFF